MKDYLLQNLRRLNKELKVLNKDYQIEYHLKDIPLKVYPIGKEEQSVDIMIKLDPDFYKYLREKLKEYKQNITITRNVTLDRIKENLEEV